MSADISKSEVRNFDSLLQETKKVSQQSNIGFLKYMTFCVFQKLEDESRALDQLARTNAGQANPWFDKRTMMVAQLENEIKFLVALK